VNRFFRPNLAVTPKNPQADTTLLAWDIAVFARKTPTFAVTVACVSKLLSTDDLEL
jgi:hypothetical protein